MQPTQPAQTTTPEEQSSAAPTGVPDPELWDGMIDALIAQDPWPDEDEEEPDPLGGIPLRIYEVVEVRPGEGIRLVEQSCTEDLPRYWIAVPKAADVFALGDVFGLGWNDEEASIWPPQSWADGTRQ